MVPQPTAVQDSIVRFAPSFSKCVFASHVQKKLVFSYLIMSCRYHRVRECGANLVLRTAIMDRVAQRVSNPQCCVCRIENPIDNCETDHLGVTRV
jgi:hypothetical protein